MIIIRLVNSVFQIYGLIMLARVLISWFTDLDRSAHPVVVFLHQATEPVLRPVRNVLPQCRKSIFRRRLCLCCWFLSNKWWLGYCMCSCSSWEVYLWIGKD